MKISAITKQQRILNKLRYSIALLPLLMVPKVQSAQNPILKNDIFEHSVSTITADGIDINPFIAPSPRIVINNSVYNACIVADINKNILYLYDSLGTPKKAYKIASGNKSNPTETGVRIILGKENYPYRSAPQSTKRHQYPNVYGSRVIISSAVDTTNGGIMPCDGIFIHGTNDPASIGEFVSHGCIRMNNTAIKEVAKHVKKNQYIHIIK